jgi:hypothetical protein
MTYQWAPIAPLSEEDRRIDLTEVDSLKVAWIEARERLQQSSQNNLRDFDEKLARLWSIETGILERIYDVDRGTTQILVERGFLANYIERSNVIPNPEQLVEVLRDHRAAIDLVHDCIANARPLAIGFIHELHSILTRHQHTVEGIDQFGNPISFPLEHGAFKKLPNNPKHPDGTIHEYCPPVQVQSEMEILLNWYQQYQDVDPVLAAAWLHHRFTQIHPYQDGNGRVVRALANLVLIKAGLFPVVITRDQREQYISTSEQADAGDLKPLVRLFAEIEQKTILQALSVAPDTKPYLAIVEDVAEAIAMRIKRRREEVALRLRHVNNIAFVLQSETEQHLRTLAQNVRSKLNSTNDLGIGVQVMKGGPDQPYQGKPTQHWYHFQVVTTAQQTKQRVNFEENHYFVRARLSAEGVPWLTYVVSFHHVGQELSGVMEATAFAEISFPQSDEELSKTGQIDCMVRPFTITYKDDAEQLKTRLLEWVSETFVVAVKQWGDVL